jgi:secreted PhoX family phosphatase
MSDAARAGMDGDEQVERGESLSPIFQEILGARLARRDVLRGGVGLAATAFLSHLGLTGCDSEPAALGFEGVPMSRADLVLVPPGYQAHVLYALGDPINPSAGSFLNNGTQSFEQRAGDHHDALQYFPLPRGGSSSTRGLLAMNHENITQAILHPNGPTTTGGVRPVDEVRREMSAHGVSVIEVERNSRGDVQVVTGSAQNRRINPNTPMRLSGPVAGSALVRTAYSPDGRTARGTLNNCANGYTPWGAYLTCEENWAGYFKSTEATRPRDKARYGVAATSAYSWDTATSAADLTGEFARFDATPKAAEATGDFRNEANTFGWVVEIDPYDPQSVPVKRTALGRLAHEGAWCSIARAGRPLAIYMGDDGRGEYIYKFVTAQNYTTNADGSILDSGTLYAAKFNEDGTGSWLPLTMDNPALAAAFADLADLLVNARTAADIVGATRMDRPEWATVHPTTGEVYLTLTNNSQRGVAANQRVDAANPRHYDAITDNNPDLDGNVNGHIIRWRENGDTPAATTFTWDIFLFGARPDAPADVNLSGLTAANSFASPDGLWFDGSGLLWIQTDDGSILDITNNQMLAVIPGRVGDGGRTTVGGQATFVAKAGADLRRFLVGPVGCELTGVVMTPDRRTMFVNIQHPGEDSRIGALTSSWPSASGDATVVGTAGSRPRSATVVISRTDGGVIGA